MREIRLSGLEGGGAGNRSPYPYPISIRSRIASVGYVWNVALGIARPNCRDGRTACPPTASERRGKKRGGFWLRRSVSSPLKKATSRSSRGNEAQISLETEAI